MVSQIVIPHKKRLGGALPFAFTQEGVAILQEYCDEILKSYNLADFVFLSTSKNSFVLPLRYKLKTESLCPYKSSRH